MSPDAQTAISPRDNTLDLPQVDDLKGSGPSHMPRLNMNLTRVCPAALARIATMLEENGSVIVTNAYVDPNGAGMGALELGKAFQQFLEARTYIKARIVLEMGPDWMHDRDHLSIRELFDHYADAMHGAEA